MKITVRIVSLLMCMVVLFGVGALVTQAYETGELSDKQKEDIERVSQYLENETSRGIVYAWLLDSDNFAYHNESESKSIFASITTTLDYETAKDSLVKILAPTYTAIYEKQLTIEGVRLLSGVLKQFAAFIRISSPTAADAIQNNAEDIAKDVIQMGVSQSKLLDGILDYTDGEDKNLIVEMLSEFVDSDMYYTLVEELSYVAKEFEFVIESLDMWFEIQVIQSADEEFISLLEELYESDSLSSVMKKAIRSFINDHDTLHVTMRTVGKATVKLAVEEGLEAGFDAFLKFLGKKCPAVLFWKYCIKAGIAVSDFLFNTSEITQFMRGVYVMNEYSEALLDIIESKVNLYSTAKGVLKAYYAHQIIYDLKILKNMRVVGEENMLQLKESTYSSKFVVAFGQWTSGYWKDIDTINKWYSIQQENFGLVDTWLFGVIKLEPKPTPNPNPNPDTEHETELETEPEPEPEPEPVYSEGLEFTSNGDGTCYVSGIGSCNDTDISIPPTSPMGYSVTRIGSYAFEECDSLTSITIPEGVTSIGDYTFRGCEILASITIPTSVTSIGDSAFYDCTALTEIRFNATTMNDLDYGNCVFHNAGKNGDGIRVIIGVNVTKIPAYLFSPSSYYTSPSPPKIISVEFEKESVCSSIGDSAFSNCMDLTSITIPEGVTSIGDYAFYDCTALTEIRFNATTMNDLGYGNCVFHNAGKNGDGIRVIIGVNVTKIPAYLFSPSSYYPSPYPPKIVSVEFEEGSVCSSIGDSAFLYCESLTSITIPEGATSIGDYAFLDCASLTSITIPESATSIGDYAFWGCYNLTSIMVAEGNTVYHSYGNCLIETATKTLILGCNTSVIPTDGSVSSIGDYAFEWRQNLTSITIPEGVTSIGNAAFSNCRNLTSITIPEGVTSIGNSAFNNCMDLTSITIPASVTSIGNYAFYDCSSLTSITIPVSVTSIGNYAFYDCSSLTSITIPVSVTSIGNYAFRDCSSLTSITIPASVTSIGDSAFSGGYHLTSIIVAEGNTAYHSYGNCLIETATKTLILGCNTSVIPTDGSVTSIGNAAFYNCRNLTSITIPESVTSIGNGAFFYCWNLSSITIPESVTSIGDSAFFNCMDLTSITIPASVTSIGDSTFEWCQNLRSITIPEGVTSIGDSAFNKCFNLDDVYYLGTEYEWNSIFIGGYNSPLHRATIYRVVEPTCTEDGYTYDIFSYGQVPNVRDVVPALGHDYVETSRTEATCTADGYTTHTCTRCGDSYIDGKVPAEGHAEVIDPAKVPTCIETGLAEGKHCSVCGEVITAQTEIPSKGHAEAIDPAKAPTCTETGLTEGKHCSTCGEILVAQTEVAAMGHTPGDWTITVEPAIGTEGKKQQACTACGEVLNEEVIPALPEETEPETEPVTEPVTEPESEPTPETEPVTEPATAPETTAVTEPVTEPEPPEETTEASDGQVTVTIPVDGCSGSILSCGLLMLIALAGAALIKRKE